MKDEVDENSPKLTIDLFIEKWRYQMIIKWVLRHIGACLAKDDNTPKEGYL
jgi:hypothetical protein